MTNTKRQISVVLADTQFLTNEALRAMLAPLYRAFYTVSTFHVPRRKLQTRSGLSVHGPGLL